uniref:Uncharacterized protein n=1 Tax=Ditylenchus dipsaci TaxID=166011 RepID=A0A915DJL7_9BILA
MANLNAVNIHQFFAIMPDVNGDLWAVCFYCLGGPYRMRHAQHFGHLYAHCVACHQTNLLHHALRSIQNPVPFNAIANLNAQNAQILANNAALNAQLNAQIIGLQAQVNNNAALNAQLNAQNAQIIGLQAQQLAHKEMELGNRKIVQSQDELQKVLEGTILPKLLVNSADLPVKGKVLGSSYFNTSRYALLGLEFGVQDQVCGMLWDYR